MIELQVKLFEWIQTKFEFEFQIQTSNGYHIIQTWDNFINNYQ